MARKRDELANHIDRLSMQHDIDIVESKSRGGWARKRARTISIKPVKTGRTYIIALHEIGHIIGRNRSGRRLKQEAATWDFVLEQSIVPLSPASYALTLAALQGYLRRTRRRKTEIPKHEHRFWTTSDLLAARAESGPSQLLRRTAS